MDDLGERIQRRRDELGWSRRELAERLGLSYPYVAQLETGERTPSLKNLRVISEVLGLDLGTVVSPGYAAAPFALLADSVMPSLQRPAPMSPMAASAPRAGSPPGGKWFGSRRATGRAPGVPDRAEILAAAAELLAALPPAQRLGVLGELMGQALAEAARPAEPDSPPP
jgi:transcriptional regulator with XRE-family HTH domain